MTEILSRLYNVEEAGYNQWRASCPVCCLRRPTLLIRLDSDGAVWPHCDNECPRGAILQAVGLPWSTLYPPGSRRRRRHAPKPEWWRDEPRYTRNPGPMGER